MNETRPKPELASLLDDLRRATADVVVVALATFPRIGATGWLEEQGELIEALSQELRAMECCRTYRILWGQMVVLWRTASPDVSAVLKRIISRVQHGHVEVRTLWTRIDGPRATEWIDELLGDVSSRLKFGSFRDAHVVRLVDAVEWTAS